MGKFAVRLLSGGPCRTRCHHKNSMQLVISVSYVEGKSTYSQARVLVDPVGLGTALRFVFVLDSVWSLGSLVSPWGSVTCTSNRRTVAQLCQVHT